MSSLLNINPKGVLHVGAHTAEEWTDYERHKWTPIAWVEAQPDLANDLRLRLPHESNEVYVGVVWSKSGIQMELKIANRKGSTSLLDFSTHTVEHPDIVVESKLKVVTTTLNELIPDTTKFDLIVLDIQGAELEALKGFVKRLNLARWIYCEVNKKELYRNCAKVQEIDSFLKEFGFKRSLTRWTIHGWGDAIYVNQNLSMTAQNVKQISGTIMMKFGWLLSNFRHRLSIFVRA